MRLIGLGLLSAGGILLEIALTRLLSILYFPPFVFAVISLAIFGIGMGAGLAAWRAEWRDSSRLPLYAIAAGALGLLIPLYTAFLVSGIGRELLMILIVLPYVCIGLALSTIFAESPEQSPTPVYGRSDRGRAGHGGGRATLEHLRRDQYRDAGRLAAGPERIGARRKLPPPDHSPTV